MSGRQNYRVRAIHTLPFSTAVAPLTVFYVVSNSGQSGRDRVDSMENFLVDLRNEPALTLSNQQVKKIYVFIFRYYFFFIYIFDVLSFR